MYDQSLLPSAIIAMQAMNKRTAHSLQVVLQIAQELGCDETVST